MNPLEEQAPDCPTNVILFKQKIAKRTKLYLRELSDLLFKPSILQESIASSRLSIVSSTCPSQECSTRT